MDRRDRSHLAAGPLAFALTLASVAVVWSSLVYRPLTHVGSWFLMVVLNGGFYTEPMRHAAHLLQIPAMLLMKLSGSADWTRETVWLWCLCFSVQPLVSLIVCWVLCARARAPQIFLLPLFSFATASFIMMGGAGGTQVPTAFAVFWPLFLLQWVGREGPYRTAGILLGSLVLLFTHELACVCFGALAIITVAEMKDRKNRGIETAFAVLFGAATVGLAIRGTTLSGKMRLFQESVAHPWGPAGWAAAVATGVFLAAIARESGKTRPRRRAWLLGGGWVAALLIQAAITYWPPASYKPIDTSMHLRVLSTALTGLIALAALGFRRVPKKAWAPLSWFTAAVLLQATVSDLVITKDWSTGIGNLKKIVAAKDRPCFLISDSEFERSLKPLELPQIVPLLSIVVQESRRPWTVVGVRSWTENSLRVDFCREVSRGSLPIFEDEPFPLSKGAYLDYARLRS